MDTGASNESDEAQSDRQRSGGDEEDDGDEKDIFSLIVDPAPTRAASRVGKAPQALSLTPPSLTPAATLVGRVSQAMPLSPTADAPSIIGWPTEANSKPNGVGSPERINNPSIGGGESDVSGSPVPTSPGWIADGAMPSPVLSGREARRFE